MRYLHRPYLTPGRPRGLRGGGVFRFVSFAEFLRLHPSWKFANQATTSQTQTAHIGPGGRASTDVQVEGHAPRAPKTPLTFPRSITTKGPTGP